jgi:glycosyltransferase involved in cell wall biosynthesis
MPADRPISLSVIIPAFNEEKRIGKTLRSVGAYLKKQTFPYEIIVVDDGSMDKTAKLVRGFARYIPNIKLLQFPKNRGKGWAVREGMLFAIGRYRLFMDADGSTSIDHWPQAYAALVNGADVVVGSRHIAGASIKVRQAPHREILGKTFRGLVRMIFRMPIVDTQNGFKAFGAEAAERIFRRQQVTGWAFDVEVLSIARRLYYSVIEMPINWIDDDRSRMTFRAMPKMLSDLFRIRIRAVQPRPIYRSGEAPQLIRLS